ncbi:nuclease-related domain-containing protein [Alteribacter aurantiacus]|uniref:nuclease-related domain-containing protein n=1 Tax=Alteribacter aurantiacus TaxID=254410 RepID=UPI0003FF8E2B|nr:nuclease-related domain-containing protein [Alteribacter aurantiacus]
MFIKPIVKPNILFQYEALLPRLRESYPNKPAILSDYKRILAGYYGEKSLQYYLSRSPSANYQKFHSIRLSINGNYFQMDFLLIAPEKIFILEVKNIAGTLKIQPSLQQVEWTNTQGITKILPDFVIQAESQKTQLNEWLNKHCPSNKPIETLVIIANQSCQLVIPKEEQGHPSLDSIIRSPYLPAKLDSLSKTNTNVKPHQNPKLQQQILTQDCPQTLNILKNYDLSDSDLISGFRCTCCSEGFFVRWNRKWKCYSCEVVKKTSEIVHPLLMDFRHLHGPLITNYQFRRFASVTSSSQAYKTLRSLNLPTIGTKKSTTYNLEMLAKL